MERSHYKETEHEQNIYKTKNKNISKKNLENMKLLKEMLKDKCKSVNF